MMKILFLAHIQPWPANSGTRLRVYHLIKGLAANHEVTLIYFSDEDSPVTAKEIQEGFKGSLFGVYGIPKTSRQLSSPNYRGRWDTLSKRLNNLLFNKFPDEAYAWYSESYNALVKELVDKQSFDFVWVERIRLATFDKMPSNLKLIIDVDELESQSYFRELRVSKCYSSKLLHWLDAIKTQHWEKIILRSFDAGVVCKEDDIKYIRKNVSLSKAIPNGVEITQYEPHWDNITPKKLLFVGLMSYYANEDAVNFFANEILPLLEPDYRLDVAGGGVGKQFKADLSKLDITFNGFVPELSEAYESCEIVVAPLRLGGGTKLKVLEALSRERPLVATSVAAEGLNLVHGEHCLIADSAQQFSECIKRLHEDPFLAKSIAKKGRAFVEKNYSWEIIYKAANSLIEELSHSTDLDE
jgi:glycosyltransferase involved in cell wall biosynthesis